MHANNNIQLMKARKGMKSLQVIKGDAMVHTKS